MIDDELLAIVAEVTDQKAKPKVKLVGEDGNIFNLASKCGLALKKARRPSEARAMYDEVGKAGSYDEALQVLMRYVDAY